MELPSRLDTFLRSHHELAAAWELRGLGVDRGKEGRLVAHGLLDRALPGVVRGTARAGPEWQPVAAAVRYLQRDPCDRRPLAVTGSAALALHGLDGCQFPARPVLAVPEGRRIRLGHAPFELLRDPVTSTVRRHGLPVATVERAIRDLARAEDVDDARVRHAVDAARWAGALRPAAWAAELRQHPHSAARLRSLHNVGVFEQESEGERWAFDVLFRPHPPLPDCQVWVLPGIRVDFVFLYAALVVEYLGDVHTTALQADSSRTFALTRSGYLPLPVTATMLREPDEVALEIHALRRRREALAARGLLDRAPLPIQRHRLRPLRTLGPSSERAA